MKLLPEIRSDSNDVRLHNSDGIWDSNWLYEISICVIDEPFPIEWGNTSIPDNWFLEISRIERWGRENISDGIDPFNSLEYNDNVERLDNEDNSIGIGPDRSLDDKSMDVNCDKFPISLGIDPDKSFSERSRETSSWSFEISNGIEPDNWLEDKWRFVSFELR